MRRGLDSGEGGPAPAAFLDDHAGFAVPQERLGVVVSVLGPGLDDADERDDSGEGASTESTVGHFFRTTLPSGSAKSSMWR